MDFVHVRRSKPEIVRIVGFNIFAGLFLAINYYF